MSFEQGPIRPPSEASSLLIRVARNCPWNRCAFCPVYKRRRFSRRSLAEVLEDIDEVGKALDLISEELGQHEEGTEPLGMLSRHVWRFGPGSAMQAAARWLLCGEGTVFLQDADPLCMRTEQLEEVLLHLKERLKGVERVTAYARTATLAARGPEKLRRLREAGLDRVHVGIESGSDRVLDLVSKGATAAKHQRGGRAAMEAGLELSAYIMPGLGGRELWREHAIESARCIAAIEPHFTRLRTLALNPRAPLAETAAGGGFELLDDDEVMQEIRLFLEHLEGVRTRLCSDHILNLLGDLEGDLPEEHKSLLEKVDRYLDLQNEERITYRTGRRAGMLQGLDDLDDPPKRANVEALVEKIGANAETVNQVCSALMSRWV